MAENDFREDTVDLSSQNQLREFLINDWLPGFFQSGVQGRDKHELAAVILCVKTADHVAADMDGEGCIEWIHLTFDGDVSSYYPDDGWDGGAHPLYHVISRVQVALDAAVGLVGGLK